jgi:hypothetical protein
VTASSNTERLRSYGGNVVTASVYHPTTTTELRKVLRIATDQGKRITFRGGGHAFDTQSLNNEIVVSLTGLDSAHVVPERATVVAGPGATWGKILEETLRYGMVPFVIVTTKHTTAAGTASSDCVTRFSPSCGKEGWHILSIRLLTMSGEELVCSRDQNRDVFFAVIGGLGYIGVIIEVEHRLLPLGYTPAVESRVTPCTSLAKLMQALVPRVHAAHAAQQQRRRDGSLPQGGDVEAIYAVCFKQRALLFHSRYLDTTRRQPLHVLHEPEKLRRRIVDLLLRVRLLNAIVWWFIFAVLFRREHTYIDGLQDYTFFMDGNVHAKQLGQRLGFAMHVLQQTFIVPATAHDHAGEDAPLHETANVATQFLQDASEALAERKLVPTLLDIMFVPKDEEFLLSSSNQLSGYAITFAFDTSNATIVARAEDFLVWATSHCRAIGGRLSLVKNVRAQAEDIAAMYGENLAQFFAIKQRLDPDGLIRNEFFERIFSAAMQRTSTPPREAQSHE